MGLDKYMEYLHKHQEMMFRKLIKKDQNQIFLFTSPCQIKLAFASHPWFVVSQKGEISRWEVLADPNCCYEAIGHLHKDFLPPTFGMYMLPDDKGHNWPSKLLGYRNSEEHEYVNDMIEVITTSPEHYWSTNYYNRLGPNSNTFAQHILDQFPESGLKLLPNAIGKGYTHRYDF